MKVVYLDPMAHDSPSAEEFSIYALCPKNEYSTHDDFLFATIATDFFPKDERWYSKSIVRDKNKQEELFTYISGCPEIKDVPLKDVTSMIILNEAWDDVDFSFETDKCYYRIHWYTTA